MISQQRTFEILNKAKYGDKPSQVFDFCLSFLILANLAAVCLESVKSINEKFYLFFLYFEYFSVTIFSLEYILRIWSQAVNENSISKTSFGRRVRYIFSFTGIIDLLAILPSLLPLIAGGLDLRWLRVLRMVRLLKISHYSSALEDLMLTVFEERRSLGAALYLFLIAIFLSSAMMYLAEHEAQPEFFSSIPQTMWWSIITLTTVGYGDVSPITPIGQIIGAMTAIMGVSTVALLTGIVASGFSNQMSRRKEIVEAEITAALSDGIISEEEEKNIEKLRKKLNLSEEHINSITEVLKHEKSQKLSNEEVESLLNDKEK